MTTYEAFAVDDGPIVAYDMPEHEYHATPGLSYSGAKMLLPPSCPAKYRYERDHPKAPKRAFDLGHAAHRIVLGAGADLVVVDAHSYRTKAAQEARDAAYEMGKVPLLPTEYESALAMAEAVRSHPLAGKLFTAGRPEVSMFWTDELGVNWHGRIDWLRLPTPAGLHVAVDLKTTPNSHPVLLPKTVDDFSYTIQDAVYLEGMHACGLWPAAFVFVFVEKEPPHVVSVGQLTELDIDIGRQLARRAAEIFRDCTASGIWPGHADTTDIVNINLPPYARRRHEGTILNDID